MKRPVPSLFLSVLLLALGGAAHAQGFSSPKSCDDINRLAALTPPFSKIAQGRLDAIPEPTSKDSVKTSCASLRTLKVDLNTVDAVGDYCQMTQPADKLTVSPYRAVVDVAQSVLQSAEKKERRMKCADLD